MLLPLSISTQQYYSYNKYVQVDMGLTFFFGGGEADAYPSDSSSEGRSRMLASSELIAAKTTNHAQGSGERWRGKSGETVEWAKIGKVGLDGS